MTRLFLVLTVCALAPMKAGGQTLYIGTLTNPPPSLARGERITLKGQDSIMAAAVLRHARYLCEEGIPTVFGPIQSYIDRFGDHTPLRCRLWRGHFLFGDAFLFVDTTGTHRILVADMGLVGGRWRFDSLAAAMTGRLGAPRRCTGPVMSAPFDRDLAIAQWPRPGLTTQLRLVKRQVTDTSGTMVELQIVRGDLACGLWVGVEHAM